MLTFVRAASCSSEMPRCTRSRRRFGPKAWGGFTPLRKAKAIPVQTRKNGLSRRAEADDAPKSVLILVHAERICNGLARPELDERFERRRADNVKRDAWIVLYGALDLVHRPLHDDCTIFQELSSRRQFESFPVEGDASKAPKFHPGPRSRRSFEDCLRRRRRHDVRQFSIAQTVFGVVTRSEPGRIVVEKAGECVKTPRSAVPFAASRRGDEDRRGDFR